MFDCVLKRPLLSVKKKGIILHEFRHFHIILYNFMMCPVFIDTKQTLRYKVAVE